ncbi:ATPase, AAA family [Oesophagostomum dentatum]|uniref:ATPase, AAA family n=1 Tax=Oesophagostomum dentatum TaxID=61180 RepID=A0A0B1T9G5_OESDE|nr:ATPase, AAA family [Oesophagostomum dentatum]
MGNRLGGMPRRREKPEHAAMKVSMKRVKGLEHDLLHLNALVMVKASGMFKNVPTAIVGVLPDTIDSSALGHKLDKPPKETFEDIGGLEGPIQEMRESVELPLTHPEYYEEMGITAPKGVILYGKPGTGKTLLAKAVANSTSATFIRATGADLVQKNSGDGAKLVRELFKMAKDNAPSIVFLDEIDAVGTKRYDTSSRGEQEVMIIWSAQFVKAVGILGIR